MDERRWLATPLLLVILLIGVYLGSYWLLVNPFGELELVHDGVPPGGYLEEDHYIERHFSHGGAIAEVIFWPVRQIDQRLRPEAWANEPNYTPNWHSRP